MPPFYIAVHGGFLIIERYATPHGQQTKVYTVGDVRLATPFDSFEQADANAKWAVGQLYPPDLRYFALLQVPTFTSETGENTMIPLDFAAMGERIVFGQVTHDDLADLLMSARGAAQLAPVSRAALLARIHRSFPLSLDVVAYMRDMLDDYLRATDPDYRGSLHQ